MKTLSLVIAAGFAFTCSPAVHAMTDAECAAEWKRADVNNDGVLTDGEASRYLAAFRIAQKPIADGRIAQAVFVEQCKTGSFKVAVAEPGAPLAGANSFTEAQVTDRLTAAGYGKVTGLKKDANGVWRGTASEGSKTVNVAVDFKGNIVAQ